MTAAPALVHAQTADAGRFEQGIFELRVNGENVGDAVVYLTRDDVLVPRSALRKGGVVRLNAVGQTIDGVEYVSLRQSTPQLTLARDDTNLVIEIAAPASTLASALLDVGNRAPDGIWYTDDASAYLTYAPSLSDFRDFGLFGEFGVTAGTFSGTTSASYTETTGPVRLLSQLSYSDRIRAREFVLGDSYAGTGTLGGSLLLGGLSLSSRFDLDPYRVRVPQLGYQGAVTTPSTVDVYVNGVLVRRVPVAPGEFQLTGLAPESGSGRVRYVVRDAVGRQTEIERNYYAASSLLARGTSEYVYALGFARERYGSESFHYGRPLFVARHRLGFTDHVSAGARAEVLIDRVSGGPEFAFGSELGELELALAASSKYRALEAGTAALLAYGYQAGRVSWRAVAKVASQHYSNASLKPSDDRELFELSTGTGLALGAQSSLATQLVFASARDAGLRQRLSVTLSTQPTRDVSTQVLLSRNHDASLGTTYEAFATISVSLPFDHSGTLYQELTSAGASTTASISRAMSGREGFSYQASATEGRADRYTLNGQAQASFGRLGAAYFDTDGSRHTYIDGGGTLVIMPEAGIFVSRPVQQAFAVVEVPATPGVPVYLNNQLVAETNSSGRAFVADLLPYYANRLRVDGSARSANEEIDNGEVLVAPPARGGAHVVFHTRQLFVVRGTLLVSGLPPNAVRYGELVVEIGKNRFTSPIGKGGEFELDGLPAGAWPATATGEGGTCDLVIWANAADPGITDIGPVSCTGRAAGAVP